MNKTASSVRFEGSLNTLSHFAGGLCGMLWNAIRISLYGLLVALEPIVRSVVGSIVVLGLLVTLLFKIAGAPNFPLWTMLAICFGFVTFLGGYYLLLRILSIGERG